MKSSQPPRRPVRGPEPRPGGPPAPPQSPDVERAIALRDVLDHAAQVQREAAKSAVVGRSWRRTLALAVTVPVLGFSVYSWIARPTFIWGAAATPLPPQQQEAGLRFAMYLLAQRVEAYRVEVGKYPASLEEVGHEVAGVSYTQLSDSVFELRAQHNGGRIVYRSSQSPDTFLGESAAMIRGRR